MKPAIRGFRRTPVHSVIKRDASSALQNGAEVWVPENVDVPTVECDTVDGVVQSITIRCSCGCVTELLCDYE
jgi:hypothetical protein